MKSTRKLWRETEKMRGQKQIFSQVSDEWSTPQQLFDELDKEFHFTLDPCATSENAKCKRFYTINDDGLNALWGGERLFVNPPYSDVKTWVCKAYNEATNNNATVVMLLPSRTDTKWFHEYVYNKAEIRFIRGRLKFSESKNNAPFPSMIVIFRPKQKVE